MSARNVNLTAHLAAFVDAQVSNGKHRSASEVVREALRRYEAALMVEANVAAAVHAAVRETIAESGRVDLTSPDVVAALVGRLTRRVAVELQA